MSILKVSPVAQRKRIHLQCRRYQRCGFNPWPWRRKWQPIPVFLPGDFRGQSVGSQRVGHDWAHMLRFSVLHLWLLSFQWIDSIACTDFLPCKVAFLLKNLRVSLIPQMQNLGPWRHTHIPPRGAPAATRPGYGEDAARFPSIFCLQRPQRWLKLELLQLSSEA